MGGIETAVKQYARWYKQLGYSVTVLCCANKRHAGTVTEDVEGVRVIRSSSLGNMFSLPLSPAFVFAFLRKAKDFDIIHINLQFPLASFAAWLQGPALSGKLIVSYHCDVYRQRFLKCFTYFFDRQVVKKAAMVITGSPVLRETSEVLSWSGRRNIQILPYSIDFKRVENALRSDSPVNLPDTFRREGYYIFFGRLVSYKGTSIVDEALRALLCKGCQLNIVVFGVGPESSRFLALREDFPNNVFFFNEVLSRAEKYHLLMGAKAFLFPSQFASEAFGITQLEAMAAGKAIINADLGTGVNWVAPDGVCAVTIQAGSSTALVKALQECEAGLHDLPALGAAGRQRAFEMFREEVIQEQFSALLNSHGALPGADKSNAV